MKRAIASLIILSAPFAVALLTVSCTGRQYRSAYDQDVDRIKRSTDVLRSMVSLPENAIPVEILRNAYAIAVIPDVVKAAFGIGGRYGKGVLAVRTENNEWSYPSFITTGGGSIGWQWGVESVDLVLVFKNRRGVETLENGSFTLGADVAVAAGPVGRHTSASTDAQLNAQILSYARAKGLFVGASLDGTSMGIDDNANAVFYNSNTVTARRIFSDSVAVVPEAAIEFAREAATVTRGGGSQSPQAGY